MVYTFTGAVAYDRLGSSWRTAAGLRSVSVTDPATGLLPTNLVQGGVAVTWLTADANSRYSFTCDVPGVVVDFGAGAEALYANEVPGLAIAAGGATTTAIDAHLGGDATGLVATVAGKLDSTVASSTYVRPNLGATLAAYGDSITAGEGASNPTTLGYAPLLAAVKGLTLTNFGTNGDQAWDQVDDVVTTVVASDRTSTLMIGTNDQRTWSTDATKRGYFAECHAAMAAWLAIPHAHKSLVSAGATESGAWGTTPIFGGALVRNTGVVGETQTFSTFGRVVYLWTVRQNGNSSTFTITVDGTMFGPYATTTTVSTGTIAGRDYGLRLIRIPGLSDNAHTVVMTATAASGGAPVYFVGGAGPGGATTPTGPNLFVGNVPRFTAAGYSLNGGTDATVRDYGTEILSTVRDLASDGLNVALVDIAARLNITTHLGADGVHPNDTGHAVIRDAFLEVMSPLPFPRERSLPGNGEGTLLVRTNYNPAGIVTLSGTTTFAVVDGTNLIVTFTAPDTGSVKVTMDAVADVSAAGNLGQWALFSGGSLVAGTNLVYSRIAELARFHVTIPVSGLTPGTSYTWAWAHRVSAGTNRIICGNDYGPALITVRKDA